MFSSNSKPKEPTKKVDYNSVNIIGEGSEIEGNIISSSSFRVDGKVTGNTTIKGKLLVSPKGVIDGDIQCEDAEICGEVRGNVHASNVVSIKSTAKITGDIYYKQIEIEQGANLDCKLQQTTGNSAPTSTKKVENIEKEIKSA